jgi:hypothetical protein
MNGKQAKRARRAERVRALLTKTEATPRPYTPGPADMTATLALAASIVGAATIKAAAAAEQKQVVKAIAEASMVSTAEVEAAVDRLNTAWGDYWSAMDRHTADAAAIAARAERRDQ